MASMPTFVSGGPGRARTSNQTVMRRLPGPLEPLSMRSNSSATPTCGLVCAISRVRGSSLHRERQDGASRSTFSSVQSCLG